MIESIKLKDAATFRGDHAINGLKKINYFYGSNGAGKTTISKGIASDVPTPECQLTWQSNFPVRRMVYNKDFIDANFSQPAELKGIFTLGQQEIGLQAKIDKAKEDCKRIREKVAELTLQLEGNDVFEGRKEKLAKVEEDFKKACWQAKLKHDGTFREIFAGIQKSKEKFRDRVLEESVKNTSSIEKIEALQAKIEIVFSPAQLPIPLIAVPSFVKLVSLESNAILAKKVVGKKDIDIAAMIERLGNSDWVKNGQPYFEKNDGACPFCQQEAHPTLKKSLESYFDESFVADSKAIANLETDYAAAVVALKQLLEGIVRDATKHLAKEALEKEMEVLQKLLAANAERIAQKKKEPSRVIALECVTGKSKVITSLIEDANKGIAAHNKTIANRESEKKILIGQVWRFMLDNELKKEVADYKIEKEAVEKAILGIENKIRDKETEFQKATASLQDMEKKTTSVQPTVDDINKHLTSFGFQGFSLAIGSTPSSYKLIREDGKPAKETLSEGEKTFVTFLYFFHLLKGNNDPTNVSSSRVVIFDDPVCSLDSDVLHIVSCLIKGLLEDISAEKGAIKQIFIMTHNAYFHKEASYHGKMKISSSEVTWWIIRKRSGLSEAKNYEKNPVKTSYDMLWAELSDNHYSHHTIQNTMRRILESASRLLGGIELKSIEDLFKGTELSACRTLMCWVHDGSHFSHDDICIAIEASSISIYLKVFETIFEGCGHGRHYRMMMRLPEPVVLAAAGAVGAA